MLKSILRKKILKKRRLLYSKKKKIEFEKIKLIIKKLKLNNPVIGGYFPVNYEIDCLNILRKFEDLKFRVSLPAILKNNKMEFFKFTFKDPLKVNKYGIPEPSKKKIINPDLILVPLVAFDQKLFRIGYGGGFYDRYIEKLNKRKNFYTIGFANSCQKIYKVPKNKFDKKLNFVITEKKIYK